MPSLLDPDDDQTLGQTGAGLLRIGQDDGSDQGAALADLYRRVTEPQAAPTGSPHMLDAQQDLGLTPQEQYLYQTHLDNLAGPGKVLHPDGAISTLYQMSFGQNGKYYNIPTVWGGKIVPPDDAIARANKLGLERFPSYSSEQEAEDRYSKMHGYMERDTGDYLRQQGNGP
jgi:hypothetical protein